MAVTTIGGLFENSSRGEQALKQLKDAGFSSAQISELADNDDPEPKKLSNPFTDFFKDHTTTGNEFQDNLTELGMSKAEAAYFEEGIARGGSLVTVKADERGDEARKILQKCGADLGSGNRGYDDRAYDDRDAAAATSVGAVAAAPRGVVRDVRDERGDLGDTELQKIQLRAERLAVDKTRVASGTVRIGKRVVSEERSMDVPVSHDELVIERHKVEGGAVGGTIGDDKTISVPLSRDEIHVNKETYATEEVEIGKRAVAGTERVSETVRHEELVVDGDKQLDRTTDRR